MFKMIGMGDLHFPSKNKQGELLSTEERKTRDTFYNYYMNEFFKQDADIYFSVGDITTSGDIPEFDDLYRMIRKYNRNFRQVLGNHDLLQYSRKEIYDRLNCKNNSFYENGDVILVYLETGREMDRKNFGGWISEEQKEWLSSMISKSGAKTLVIIAHHPVYNTTKNTVEDMHHVDPKTELWSVLEKKKDWIGIYINGHIHEDSIAKRNNWHFIQFCSVLDDPALRLFEFSKDTFSYQTHRLTDSEMKEKATCIGQFNEQFRLQEDGPGTEKERNLIIDLNRNLLVN
ncbi:hypothetical protein D8M04_07270 [Oceanobacillus piezotolerans]|uniref:Calcineurin-like phosphoesterase domain-containing protein n=1 Tax=Oceanobacillus piezotolerans TaxID=2448030 RepID=A0A498D8V4_9BACI|nr:metallophosphoesterase [Oceanobacillus piezotolerans]RLL46986.1 hypothetical protein D8M04_07270 [Oceanobacillus piezotolerans]